ncbi:prenyltransferase [Paucilactobacillus nenjiangensis]|uniref:prenyltransferase n=1 Tax=Paucilactobacillus nenjiangensis TaxID=1296540 RepID=UPI003BB54557
MSLAVFLELVEIKAKTASVLPFLIGICFSWYNYHALNLGYVILFFIAMFIFNMAVDILDNLNDYNHAVDELEYKRKTNIIGREHLSVKLVFSIMITMVIISALIGVVLAWLTGWPLLIMGLWCYLVGVFYSSGPHPFSSMPLGELLSGVTMGFMIILISIYLNTFEVITWNVATIAKIALIALPTSAWIANLMLANNISDLDEDESNLRYTLPHYLGKKRAVNLFVLLNVIAFIAIIGAVLVKIAPWTMLITLVVVPIVVKQTRIFMKKQVKKETFVTAIRILAIGSFAQVVSYAVGLFL